jgi:hypothetical protein
MPGFSHYLEGKIIGAVFRGLAFPAPPANLYLALFTASPGEAGELTNELVPETSPGYARVTLSTLAWGTPVVYSSGTLIANAGTIEFPGANGDWTGPITHFALLDAASFGNVWFHGALSAPRTVLSGDVLRFGPGALSVLID